MKNLKVLKILDLQNNQLNSSMSLIDGLHGMQFLEEIRLEGNDVCSNTKHRDHIVMMSPKSLQWFCNKKVLPKEREYLFTLYQKKGKPQAKPKKIDPTKG